MKIIKLTPEARNFVNTILESSHMKTAENTMAISRALSLCVEIEMSGPRTAAGVKNSCWSKIADINELTPINPDEVLDKTTAFVQLIKNQSTPSSDSYASVNESTPLAGFLGLRSYFSEEDVRVMSNPVSARLLNGWIAVVKCL